MYWQAVVRSSRVPFLLLTPACVFLGYRIVESDGTPLNEFHLVLVAIGALMAHISVNLLNEYSDFESGLDLHTRRTPFSGGSGSLPEQPEASASVKGAGIASLMVVIAVGIYLVLAVGPGLLMFGLLGVVVIVTYTDWLNRQPLLCHFSPGLGFGVLMVIGTQYALKGEFSSLAWMLALVPFCATNNLLLLNQYPDLDADRAVGRNHLIIAWGLTAGNIVYAINLLVIAMVIVTAVAAGQLPMLSLIALMVLVPGLIALKGAIQLGAKLGEKPVYLACNVMVALLAPTLLAATM